LGTDGFHGACPDLTSQPQFPCVWLAGVLNLNRSPDYKQFGPRVGFAWDPLKKGTTVIRGGYGMYFDRVVLEVPLLERLVDGRALQVNVLAGSTCKNATSGAAQDCSAPNSVFNTGTPTLANPFTGAVARVGLGGINVLDNKIAHPRVQQFSLGVQQQFWKNWVVSADAIHNYGTRFLIGHFLRKDRAPASAPAAVNLTCVGNAPCTVTDPLTGRTDNITNVEPSARTWYDGLLVGLQRPSTTFDLFGRKWGYSLNLNYTLSKTFNYANDDQIPFNGAEDQVNVIEGINNIRIEKGYAPTDERHRLVFFGVFQLPWDFSVSPIYTFGSGVPADTFVPGINARLPILPRNALGRDIKTGADLNKAILAFNALPLCPAPAPCNAPDASGNRTILATVPPGLNFGDKFNSVDMRITKSFKFLERNRFELIAEVFNLFNGTNIRGFNNKNFSGRTTAIPNASTTPVATDYYKAVSTAGGFFGSGGPRAFQFALRYSF